MSLSSDVTVAASIFYIQSVVLARQRTSIRTGNISTSSNFGPRSPATHAVVLPAPLWIRTVRAEADRWRRQLEADGSDGLLIAARLQPSQLHTQ